MKEKVYLILGANLGDRIGSLAAAREKLTKFGEIIGASKLHMSKAYGYVEQPDFINAAVVLSTGVSPWDFLRDMKAIERDLGRHDSFKWGPREIDIDIALWGRRIINEADMIIPHKGLAMRDFYLVPILEITPYVIHPVTGMKLNEHLARIPREDRTLKSVINDERWQSITT